jgi:hypothetical protein
MSPHWCRLKAISVGQGGKFRHVMAGALQGQEDTWPDISPDNDFNLGGRRRTAYHVAMQSQAVIMIDHGSRKQAATAALEAVAKMVSALLNLPVYTAHMSLAEPTLDQAVAQAASAGAKRVIVFPYFLAEGVHGAGDVPAQAARAAAGRPDVEIVLAEPLGADAAIADLVARRIRPHLGSGGRE